VAPNKLVILAHLGLCRGEIGETGLAVDRICKLFLYSVSVVVATAALQYQESARGCGVCEPGSGNRIWCGSSVRSGVVCVVIRIIPPEVTVVVGEYFSRLGHNPHLPCLLSELLLYHGVGTGIKVPLCSSPAAEMVQLQPACACREPAEELANHASCLRTWAHTILALVRRQRGVYDGREWPPRATAAQGAGCQGHNQYGKMEAGSKSESRWGAVRCRQDKCNGRSS